MPSKKISDCLVKRTLPTKSVAVPEQGLQHRSLLATERKLLVNTSRGPLIDETALIAALRSGQIGGAALDVFDAEPLPADHPFRTLPNVVATPHLGYVTKETYRLYYQDAVDAIAAWLGGSPIRPLNRPTAMPSA